MVIIASGYRPKSRSPAQEQPHIVNATVPNVILTPVDATITGAAVEDIDFFVAANGDDTNNGTSENTPWRTIARVNQASFAFSGGEVVGFRGGDTFSDTILSPGASGSSGARIKLTSYGTGQAIISGTGKAHAVDMADKNFITFDNLRFDGTQGGSLDNTIQIEDCDDLEILDCNFPGNFDSVPVAPNGRASHIDFRGGAVGSRRFLIDGCTFTDANNNDVSVQDGDGNDLNGTVSNCTFNQGAKSGEGDKINFGVLAGNSCTFTSCVFDNEDWGGGENIVDIKAGNGHVFNSCTFLSARQSMILVHRGTGVGTRTNVTFNDCDFSGFAETGGRGINVNDNAIGTFNRCKFSCDGWGSEMIRVGGATNIATGAEGYFNACSFIIPSGESVPRMIACQQSAVVEIINTTLVSRIENTLSQLVNSDGSCAIEGRNSVFDTDGTAPDVTNNTGDWTISNNLYNVGSGQNLGGTGSTTGDPDFNSEDPDNANFLLPNAGSPALNLGSSTFAPATDLVGTPYDNPPNAGCREGNA